MTVGKINFGGKRLDDYISDALIKYQGCISDDIVRNKLKKIYSQREEVLTAFIAKYGFEPDRFVQVEQEMPNGTREWWVKRMTDEEMKARSLDSSAL